MIVAMTGARPILALTRALRVRHDPWLEGADALAPLIDPNEHSSVTVHPHGHRELAHPEPDAMSWPPKASPHGGMGQIIENYG